jgi:hypothetical protein
MIPRIMPSGDNAVNLVHKEVGRLVAVGEGEVISLYRPPGVIMSLNSNE